jgi:ketosteroid isomerase-like protein
MSDRDEIIDLTIAYTWALDSKETERLRAVFTPDATAVLRGVECAGIDAIIERIGRSIARLDLTQHLIGNHEIVVDGDVATCRCQLHGQHVRADAKGGDTFVIGGVYEDRLVRTPDGWRIGHRVMRQTWSSGNPEVVRR